MSQVQRKFIADNANNGAKIRLDNGETLRARNAANSADIDILKVRADDVIEFLALPEVNPSLPIPSAPKQLATLEYIDNVVLGKQDAKDAVNALADAQLALTGTAPLVIDGITIANGNRIGLVGQTDGTENGIYTIAIVATNYTLTRSSDSNSNAEVTTGLYFKVVAGTAYAGYECLLTTDDPIVLGTTALTFAKYPSTLSMTAGDGLARTGNDLYVDIASLGGLESTNAGQSNGQLKVKVDQAALEKDKTTRLDPSTGAVSAKKSKKATFTLSAGDVTNQYVDLTDVAADSSVLFSVTGAGAQAETDDYTVNYTGGASSKTRITFAGGLATGGVSALVAGDKVVVNYTAF